MKAASKFIHFISPTGSSVFSLPDDFHEIEEKCISSPFVVKKSNSFLDNSLLAETDETNKAKNENSCSVSSEDAKSIFTNIASIRESKSTPKKSKIIFRLSNYIALQENEAIHLLIKKRRAELLSAIQHDFTCSDCKCNY
jgi:hypothetical protein